MNKKFFEKKVARFGFVAFALALDLVACGDGGSTNGPSNNHEGANVSSVESEDDLPNCTENREGFARFINGTKEGFVCKDRKWVHYDMIADIDDNLPGCTGSREGLTAYLYEENRELKCVDGVWEKIGEEARSSSSEKSGSSSSREKDCSSSSVAPNSSSSVIPGTDPGSSSSVVSSSSSSVIPDSDRGSSSSKANWAYLNPDIEYGEFTDERDGQVYKTVTIGTQTWMAENLNYAPTNVSSMGSYAWSGCYSNKDENCSKYGRLYTWEVAMDKAGCGYGTYCNNSNEGAQGVCPSGWHLPTKEDWQKLVKPMANSVYDNTAYWNYNGAGIELKTVDVWNLSSNKGTNASGFSALPAGYSYNGRFDDAGDYAFFWSASEVDDNHVYYLYLNAGGGSASMLGNTKYNAFSVRCLKD